MKSISVKHQMVCALVLSGTEGPEAYMKVYGKQSHAGAKASFMAMMRRPDVKAYITEGQKDVGKAMIEKAGERACDLIGGLQQIVEADPTELVEYRRGACRYCHGVDHRYHFTPAEYRLHMKEAGADDEGGPGYNRTVAPHPDCPECFGEGIGYTYIKDTRTLSPGGRKLFAGVEQTANGAKVRVRDQIRANELLMRNKGLLDPPEGAAPAGTTPQEHAKAIMDLLAQAGAKTDVPGN